MNTDSAASEGAPRPGSEWLVGGQEMGKLVRSKDWSKTPLGPIGAWPAGLRNAVGLSLNSTFPISIAWGPEHTQIYNDAYRPFCAGKHPLSMGQDYSVCWESAFPVIGDAFQGALAGHAAFLEDQRVFLDRLGHLEETFFTFSFSPILDESSSVAGLFVPVTETTSKMIEQRRTRALRDLTQRALTAGAVVDGLQLAAQTVGEYDLDIPFALFYIASEDGRTADLRAQVGLPRGGPASPVTVDLTGPSRWPIAEVFRTAETQTVDDVQQLFSGLRSGPYPEPIASALLMPITSPGRSRPAGVLVTGISPRIPMSTAYRSFAELLASAVSTVIANATAMQTERKRAEALTQIYRAKTDFFSNVSHEFRTPLTLLLGPIEDELAALPPDAPAAQRERLETAHRNSLRLLRLVNTLLEFARIEDGRSRAQYQPTELGTFTAELAGTFRSACERAGLRLVVDSSPLSELVYVDHEMWEAIVLNLLSNAFKYTAEGEIAVSIATAGATAELVVRDTGIGIPDEALPQIFDRFYRVPGAGSRTHEGTGIGLAFVQQLVGQHGGSVRVQSWYGVGTTFTVSIPLGKDHLPAEQVAGSGSTGSGGTGLGVRSLADEALRWLVEEEDSVVAPEPVGDPADPGDLVPGPRSATPGGPSATGRRARIVWADDNADMRQYVSRLLAERYDVEAVPDGQAALDAVRRSRPDLVLSDVMMPRLDGFGLLRKLRAAQETRTIPIILLSARASEETRFEGLESGADDYLVKPFSARELFARIGAHLQLAELRQVAEQARSAEERAAAMAANEAELRQRVKERTADLAAANKDLEAFSYSISHDLRGPLRAIDGFTRLLVDQHVLDLSTDAQRYLNLIRSNARTMGNLIDDLLAFSRLGRGQLTVQMVDVGGLVRLCLDELRGEYAEREVRITVADLPACLGDPALLKQVWMNLLSNALKYTRKRPISEIAVDAEMVDGHPVYTCRDNGVGFDMRYAGKLFGVFERLHAAEEYEGTGVGLAIVEQVVRRHGGRVWVEAEVDGGAAFHFTLGTGVPEVRLQGEALIRSAAE